MIATDRGTEHDSTKDHEWQLCGTQLGEATVRVWPPAAGLGFDPDVTAALYLALNRGAKNHRKEAN
jgi:hypothetical protein